MRSYLLISLAGLLLLWLTGVVTAAPPFPNYRDLAVYTTSTPDTANPSKIIAATQFVNRGTATITISARLDPAKSFTITNGSFSARIPAGKSAVWSWSFIIHAGFAREVLTGSIEINGKRERDLYITVQAADPPDFTDKGQDKITDAAQVVATYAPRSRDSIRAQMHYLATHQPQSVITLASKGKSSYAIAVEALPAPPAGQDALAFWKGEKLTDPQKELVAAADDLQCCLKLQSGAVLPVVTKTAGPAIRLRAGKVDVKGKYDPYRLRTAGKDVIIEANDEEGLRNGVYGLLTDHLDCHWFQAKQLGEEIGLPKDQTVRLPKLDEVQGADWYSTTGVSWGSEHLWDERLRAFTDRGRMSFGHSWTGYIGRAEYPFEKFPEYYARDRQGKILDMDNGWSGTNFCSTNPEVLDIVAKKVNAFFTANPTAAVCSIDPNDYGKMCLCDRCLALDKSYGQTKEDGTEVTDRILHFSQEIENRLDPKWKDKYLGILVYGYQIELPLTLKPHDRHAGIICDMAWVYDHTRPWDDPTSARNRHFYSLVKGWGGLLKQYGYYDYYGHWEMFGPWSMVSKMREDIPAFHDVGGTFLTLECQPNFAAQGLNDYIAGRLEWDTHVDVDLLLEEFFTRYYGPAAEPMRRYWLTGEWYYNTQRPGISSPPRVCYNPAFWNDQANCLQEARAIAARLPAEQKRYADRVQVASDGFEYGRLLFDYDRDFGVFTEKFGVKVDHAAALAYLKQHRARLEEIAKKYPGGDPYWPMLMPSYLLPNFDILQQGHEEALKKQAAFTRTTTFEF